MKNKVTYIKYVVVLVVTLFISVGIANGYYNESIEQISNLEYLEVDSKVIYEITEIKRKYGIDVIFNEIDNISLFANKYDANIQYDDNIIYNNLVRIDKELEKYSEDVFSGLTIILFDSFNDNTIALASRNNNNEYKIYLTNHNNFERAMHHELFHVLEYMEENTYDENIWNKYNPKSFKYEEEIPKLNNRYVYGYEYSYNVYFVSKYSKVSSKEDRAEVFAEVMTSSSKVDNLGSDSNLSNKILYIFSMLDEEVLYSYDG